MFTITEQMVIEALETAVREKGTDHIANLYDSRGYVVSRNNASFTGNCMYSNPVNSTIPDCIVGYAFNLWGKLPLIAESQNTILGEVSLGHLEAKSVRFEGKALEMLGRAQSKQDGGKAWGEALKAARTAQTNATVS